MPPVDLAAESRLVERLCRRPFFRRATEVELATAWAAYGDAESLIESWRRVAEPTRAQLGGIKAWLYDRSWLLPGAFNGLLFLVALRMVLRAGEAFRAQLTRETRGALELPWLERRHEHVPDGWAPPFAFPPELAEWIEARTSVEARVRWQLLTALNEVQQTVYSDHLAELFRLPELGRHAARERALALNYFAHATPIVEEGLFREAILLLDALNAAVFETLLRSRPLDLIARLTAQGLAGARAYRAFVAGLDTPQWLLPPPRPAR